MAEGPTGYGFGRKEAKLFNLLAKAAAKKTVSARAEDVRDLIFQIWGIGWAQIQSQDRRRLHQLANEVNQKLDKAGDHRRISAPREGNGRPRDGYFALHIPPAKCRPPAEDCAELLRLLLANGPVASSKIKKTCLGRFSYRAYQDARWLLGITRRKKGLNGGWEMALPAPESGSA
jgi:hypothetical protein